MMIATVSLTKLLLSFFSFPNNYNDQYRGGGGGVSINFVVKCQHVIACLMVTQP